MGGGFGAEGPARPRPAALTGPGSPCPGAPGSAPQPLGEPLRAGGFRAGMGEGPLGACRRRAVCAVRSAPRPVLLGSG